MEVQYISSTVAASLIIVRVSLLSKKKKKRRTALSRCMWYNFSEVNVELLNITREKNFPVKLCHSIQNVRTGCYSAGSAGKNYFYIHLLGYMNLMDLLNLWSSKWLGPTLNVVKSLTFCWWSFPKNDLFCIISIPSVIKMMSRWYQLVYVLRNTMFFYLTKGT